MIIPLDTIYNSRNGRYDSIPEKYSFNKGDIVEMSVNLEECHITWYVN
jgi:hypothetical protein